MESKTYAVEATREGAWWVIAVPELDYTTQARTLAEVDAMARDLIAGATGTDPASFELAVQVVQPADVAERLAEAAELDRAAQEANARAAQDRRAAARLLREVHGLSAIDTARVLGVTRARVYQLLDEPAAVA